MTIEQNSAGDLIITIFVNELPKNLPPLEMMAAPKKNPYFGMRHNTKMFYTHLHNEYGNEWINRKDKYIKDLIWEYRLTTFSTTLSRLQDRGFAEIETKFRAHGKTWINRFKLNF